MIKRFFVLVITAVMLVGIFGLTACNIETLDAYKTKSKATIESYAQERKDSYLEEKWTMVCGIVDEYKQAVDAADNRAGVNKAVINAKEEIDKVEAQLCESGIILSDELRLEILNLYNLWAFSEYGNTPLDSSRVFVYYGQYSGFYVINFMGWTLDVVCTENIDGLNFIRMWFPEIYAISENYGGALKGIYEEGYLTQSELEEIHKINLAIFVDYFASK